MILYIFNQPYPDDSGFGKRCQREIEELSKYEKITVLCRYAGEMKRTDVYKKDVNQISIVRFTAKSEIIHRPENYKSNGLYELRRNIDLMICLSSQLFKILWKDKSEEKKIFVVSSPLTVPVLSWMIGSICGAQAWAVSLHDLEPELAMHIKHLSERHWIVKVEKFIEAFVCRVYEHIIVTTNAQVERLHQRTGQPLEKMCSIENATSLTTHSTKRKEIFPTENFVLVYMSTLSYDYTLLGFLDLIETFHTHEVSLTKLRIIVLGDGEGRERIRARIEKYKLEDKIKLVGKVSDPISYLACADAAIVPWQKDSMTETMLPTKLFEYLGLGIPVIVPKFGEFSKIFTDKENALFYVDQSDLLKSLHFLMNDNQRTVTIGKMGYDLFKQNYIPKTLNKKLISFLKLS